MKKLALVITILSLLSVNLLGPAVSANAYAKLCEVDIGDPLSEAGHNLQSWGPIEPDAHPSPPPNDAWSGLSGNARVIWGYNEGTPYATLTLDRHLADGVARMIRVTFLDGMHYADLISDDSFTMEVKSNGTPDTEYQQVFAHTGGFTRQWLTVDIDLAPATNLDANGLIDVRLRATGPQWGFFGSDHGQVAFDRIELWGEDQIELRGETTVECEGLFKIDYAKLDFKKKPDDDKVKVNGKLEIDLGDVNIWENVSITVGLLSETFNMVEKGKKGEKWEYKRPKHTTGIIKEMKIDWKNCSAKFKVKMDNVDLTGMTNPVTISIQIGDDFVEETIDMEVKKNHWKYKD